MRAWAVGPRGFELQPTAFRVPIGPGIDGALAALAVSADGKWLAVAGHGTYAGGASFKSGGLIAPLLRMTDDMRLDQGTIYIFNAATGRFDRALRGHKGTVLNLAFVDGRGKGKPVLVSAAREGTHDPYHGALRVWDVESGETLNERNDFPDPFHKVASGVPGLAAMRDSDGRLRVALAARDGNIRLWDVGSDQVASVGETREGEMEVRGLNDSAVFLRNGSLLTGSYGSRHGWLQGWDVGAEGGLDRHADRSISLGAGFAPRALALLKADDGAPKRLAVVVRPPDEQAASKPALLRIVGIEPGRDFGKVEPAEAALWTGALRPVLAASPDGTFLAVAGAPQFGLRIYRANDLSAEPLSLRGAGASFQRVNFVRQGDKMGLQLRPTEKEEGIVFDISGRKLTDNLTDWKPLRPNLDGWKSEGPGKGKEPVFTVRLNDKLVGRVRLGERQVVTTGAILPAMAGRPALYALAYEERGATYLALYDLSTGLPIRWLIGHVAPIRALSFTADGRFLASASDDETVAVWSLTDLGDFLGKRGQIAGLRIRDEGGIVRLGPNHPDVPLTESNRQALNAAGVEVDEQIEAITRDGKATALSSARAFFDAMWTMKPGAKVVLRFARHGNVTLTADQATDQQSPLFSLLVTGGTKAADFQWIGWNASGAYDLSDAAKLDRYLVWHHNTNKADAPVKTAPASEYRKDFYRDEILRLLLKHGNAGPALREWDNLPTPRPRMGLHLEGPGLEAPRFDRGGRLLVQQPPASLLAALNSDIHPARIRAVSWDIDGGKHQTFDRLAGSRFEAGVGTLPWQRGEHTLRFALTLNDDARTEYTEVLKLRYAPAPPTIALREKPPQVVKDGKLTLRGIIRSTSTGRDAPNIKATFIHNGKTQTLESLDFTCDVTLDKGKNTLEIRAVNEGATPDSAEYESAAPVVLHVLYEDRPAPPPVLTMEAVEHDGVSTPLPLRAPLIVHGRDVSFRGRVRSAAKLTEVLCAGKEVADFAKYVADFARAADSATFAFTEKRRLEPGENRFKFSARASDKRAEPNEVVVVYRPDLPIFTRTSPKLEREAADSLKTVLEGQLTELVDAEPFDVLVRVNGGAEFKAAVSTDGRSLSAPIVLKPGNNVVIVTLKNQYWQREPVPLNFYHKQPPLVLAIVGPGAPLKSPTVDVVARFTSRADLPLTGARIVLARPGVSPETRDVPRGDLKEDGPPKDGVQQWLASIKELSLRQGDNKIDVHASNRDGESLPDAAGTLTLTYTEPANPPSIVSSEPPGSGPVAKRSVDLAFDVQTDANSAPTKVEVSLDGTPIARLADLVATDKGGGTTHYQLNKAIQLHRGVNVLKIDVANRGGAAKPRELTLTYNPPPVVVTGLRLESRDVAGEFFDLREAEQKKPLPTGWLWLHGNLEWDREDDPDVQVRGRVLAWVNDYQQYEQWMDSAPRGNKRAFKTPLRLNREVNNIEVQFPDAKGAPRLNFTVKCERPEQQQRLHLVVFGPGHKDQRGLTSAVLRAFKFDKTLDHVTADPLPPVIAFDDLKKGVFQSVKVYPLARDSDPEQFDGFLHQRVEGAVRHNDTKFNDVIIIYFRGREEVTDKAHYLLTEKSLKVGNPSETAIDCQTLRKQLANVSGAKLLLLDVSRDDRTARDPGPAKRQADAAQKVGVLHYVWLSRTDTPEEQRLARVLEESLASAGLLKEIRDQVGKRTGKNKDLLFDSYTTENLDQIRLSLKTTP